MVQLVQPLLWGGAMYGFLPVTFKFGKDHIDGPFKESPILGGNRNPVPGWLYHYRYVSLVAR